MTRRVVRVTSDLFWALDGQLPSERGPNGEPTRAEFAASDLLDIVEAFAELWDELPMTIPGRPDYRTLVIRARLAYAVAVRGQLSPVDGAVELIGIAIDLTGPEYDGGEDDLDDDAGPDEL